MKELTDDQLHAIENASDCGNVRPMRHFSREFKDWPLSCDERLNLTQVDSHGRDLEEMLANAQIWLEDWHGNEGPAWTLGDLEREDFDAVVQMFREALGE